MNEISILLHKIFTKLMLWSKEFSEYNIVLSSRIAFSMVNIYNSRTWENHNTKRNYIIKPNLYGIFENYEEFKNNPKMSDRLFIDSESFQDLYSKIDDIKKEWNGKIIKIATSKRTPIYLSHTIYDILYLEESSFYQNITRPQEENDYEDNEMNSEDLYTLLELFTLMRYLNIFGYYNKSVSLKMADFIGMSLMPYYEYLWKAFRNNGYKGIDINKFIEYDDWNIENARIMFENVKNKEDIFLCFTSNHPLYIHDDIPSFLRSDTVTYILGFLKKNKNEFLKNIDNYKIDFDEDISFNDYKSVPLDINLYIQRIFDNIKRDGKENTLKKDNIIGLYNKLAYIFKNNHPLIHIKFKESMKDLLDIVYM